MQRLFLLVFGVCLAVLAAAQQPQHYFLPGTDSTNANGYFVLSPAKPKALLVLLPGFGGSGQEAFFDSTIPQRCAQRGIATVSVNYGEKLLLDAPTQTLLDDVIAATLKRYRLSPDRVAIGGFSAGGTLAVRYAQVAFEQNRAVKPRAVFAGDSPLDLLHFYQNELREIEADCPASKMGKNEAEYVLPLLRRDLGGTPDTARAAYVAHSGFSPDAPEGGNARFLKTVPVRCYAEPDFEWHSRERCRNMFDSNVLDLGGLVSKLRHLGNARAELILTQNRGYRSDGTRHPHSWSIIEAEACANWLVDSLAI